MRRLDAMFSDRRKRVSSSSTVGKTEKSTALRTCTADRKTSTAAAIDRPSNRSRTSAGSGISMTKTMLIAPIGSANSRMLLTHCAQSGLAALFFFAPLTWLAAGAVNTAEELIVSPVWLQVQRHFPTMLRVERSRRNARFLCVVARARGGSAPPFPGGRGMRVLRRPPHTALLECFVRALQIDKASGRVVDFPPAARLPSGLLP